MLAFITRALSVSSEFKKRLEAAGWQAEGRSLVELSPLPFEAVPAADWVFFSSQNAVRFFFQQLKPGGDFKSPLGLPPDLGQVKWAALGAATAKVLAEHVEQVDFVGTGEPGSTTEAFRRVKRRDAGLRILFPAARHSRQSVMALLADDFQCIHFPIYDNRPVEASPRSAADALVFTSPMNAEAYFSTNKWGKKQRVIAIGATTAEALRTLGVEQVEVAAAPTEKALADAVLRLRG